MAPLVQCVPNFSEGRRADVIEKILNEVRSVEGVKLLDYSSDKSHNRSVVTFVGAPGDVKEAAYRAVKKAAELINMEEHLGGHPRMGATDVIPFIPISEVTMEDCVSLANELGKLLWEELGIPVYLYEEAAVRPDRKNLAWVRKGQYEGIKQEITHESRRPDIGDARLHHTAGITAVGARPPLIAYNINLDTDNVDIAKKIANAIRGSKGGFRDVKALGIMIEELNIAQVTINMCDYKTAPLYRVFETVKNEAARYGVNVLGSEIVGLTPVDALIETAEYYLQLEDFSKEQVLEKRL